MCRSGAACRGAPTRGRRHPLTPRSQPPTDGSCSSGRRSDLARSVETTPDARIFDARGCAIVPGFVDPHTHLLYAGDRRHELRQRLAGKTYAEIADAGGGIVSTVDATRAATRDELVELGRARLAEMLRCGTTTCEIKSGYGLSLER